MLLQAKYGQFYTQHKVGNSVGYSKLMQTIQSQSSKMRYTTAPVPRMERTPQDDSTTLHYRKKERKKKM
ncbi:hypothetical protein GDO78_018109 [Eleutherodactylus coqui]|uniref:Uncharacterized protein n=1 Tax=Eleutherodactylus coqui TaxID=57060 RepID=A0A8J6EPR8_ELECQ|nr:hypothetical protein GDO78_018109 [Eleutherodactylus coqui]